MTSRRTFGPIASGLAGRAVVQAALDHGDSLTQVLQFLGEVRNVRRLGGGVSRSWGRVAVGDTSKVVLGETEGARDGRQCVPTPRAVHALLNLAQGRCGHPRSFSEFPLRQSPLSHALVDSLRHVGPVAQTGHLLAGSPQTPHRSQRSPALALLTALKKALIVALLKSNS